MTPADPYQPHPELGAPKRLRLHRRHSTGVDTWRLFDRNSICVGFLDCTEAMATRIAAALNIPLDKEPIP